MKAHPMWCKGHSQKKMKALWAWEKTIKEHTIYSYGFKQTPGKVKFLKRMQNNTKGAMK